MGSGTGQALMRAEGWGKGEEERERDGGAKRGREEEGEEREEGRGKEGKEVVLLEMQLLISANGMRSLC